MYIFCLFCQGRQVGVLVEMDRIIFFFLFFLHAFTSQLLDKPCSQALVTGVVPSPSPGPHLRFFFIVHRVQQSHCSSIFQSSVANLRFPQVNLCTEKVPTNLYEYELGGTRTHENSRIIYHMVSYIYVYCLAQT